MGVIVVAVHTAFDLHVFGEDLGDEVLLPLTGYEIDDFLYLRVGDQGSLDPLHAGGAVGFEEHVAGPEFEITDKQIHQKEALPLAA